MRYELTRFFAGRNEEEACFETARTARGFSRKTMAVLDDKLAFSATLMRAGEVDAAYRMMREAEAEVLREETFLINRVTTVAAAGSTARERMTRLRLARLLATAMVTALLMMGSIVSLALAGIIVGSLAPEEGRRGPARSLGTDDAAEVGRVRSVSLASGLEVRLKPRHARTYQAIINGREVSQHEVTELLAGLPPDVDVTDLLAGLPTEVANVLRVALGMPPIALEGSMIGQTTHKAKAATDDTDADEPSSERSSEAASEGESSETTGPGTDQSKASGTKSDRQREQSTNGGIELNLPDVELP